MVWGKYRKDRPEIVGDAPKADGSGVRRAVQGLFSRIRGIQSPYCHSIIGVPERISSSEAREWSASEAQKRHGD